MKGGGQDRAALDKELPWSRTRPQQGEELALGPGQLGLVKGGEKLLGEQG